MDNGTNGGMGAADVMALSRGGNDMVWPLVWLAFLGGNGGLFGRNGGEAAVASSAISEINSKQFDSALANAAQTTALQETINRTAADQAACCCNTQLTTQGGFKDLALQNCQATNQITSALAACCCETQKGILEQSGIIQRIGADIGAQVQLQTMTLQNQATQDTQRIIDAINAQTQSELQDKLTECRAALSNCNQTATISQVVAAAAQQAAQTVITTCGCSCNGGGPPGPPGQQVG